MAIGSDGAGGSGPISPLVKVLIGIMVLVVVFVLGPMLFGQIQTALPAMTGTASLSSPWNTSNASNNLPNGSSLWTTAAGLVTVVVIVILIVMVLRYLQIL